MSESPYQTEITPPVTVPDSMCKWRDVRSCRDQIHRLRTVSRKEAPHRQMIAVGLAANSSIVEPLATRKRRKFQPTSFFASIRPNEQFAGLQ